MGKQIRKQVQPGIFIKDGIENLGMNAEEFAIRSGLKAKTVSQLINGKTRINIDIAIKISSVFGNDPATWINLQNNYDFYLAEVKKQNEIAEKMKVLQYFNKNHFDILNVVTTKGMDNGDKIEALENCLRISDLKILIKKESTCSCFRTSQKVGETEKQLVLQDAWLLHITAVASGKKPKQEIDIRKLKNSCQKLRELSVLPQEEFIPEIGRILSDCGVIFIADTYFTGANISGFTKWTKDRKNVILAINDFGKKIDKFFFTLFHEIGHIIYGDKRYVELTYKNEISMEGKADSFATNALISEKEYSKVVKLLLERKGASEVIEFSNSIHINPSIIFGRLAYDEYISYKNYSKFQEDLSIKERYIFTKETA